jgi:hypothetical protein
MKNALTTARVLRDLWNLHECESGYILILKTGQVTWNACASESDIPRVEHGKACACVTGTLADPCDRRAINNVAGMAQQLNQFFK